MSSSKMMWDLFSCALHLYGAIAMPDKMARSQSHPLAQQHGLWLRVPLLTPCLEDLPSAVSCTGITFQSLNAPNKHVPLATECQYPSTKSPLQSLLPLGNTSSAHIYPYPQHHFHFFLETGYGEISLGTTYSFPMAQQRVVIISHW